MKSLRNTYPEHVLFKVFFLRRFLSEPTENQLAKVWEENQSLPCNIVWNVNNFLFGRIQSKTSHGFGNILRKDCSILFSILLHGSEDTRHVVQLILRQHVWMIRHRSCHLQFSPSWPHSLLPQLLLFLLSNLIQNFLIFNLSPGRHANIKNDLYNVLIKFLHQIKLNLHCCQSLLHCLLSVTNFLHEKQQKLPQNFLWYLHWWKLISTSLEWINLQIIQNKSIDSSRISWWIMHKANKDRRNPWLKLWHHTPLIYNGPDFLACLNLGFFYVVKIMASTISCLLCPV